MALINVDVYMFSEGILGCLMCALLGIDENPTTNRIQTELIPNVVHFLLYFLLFGRRFKISRPLNMYMSYIRIEVRS